MAIARASAPLVYVLNLMTKHGETDHFSASRHVDEISRYAGRVPDAVLIHDGAFPPDLVAQYEAERAYPVEHDLDALRALGVNHIARGNILSKDSLVRHDPERTAAALLELIDTLHQPSNLESLGRARRLVTS